MSGGAAEAGGGAAAAATGAGLVDKATDSELGPLTAEEVAACLRVLKTLAANETLYASRPFKAVRVALTPFLELEKANRFNGAGADEHQARREKRKEENRERMKRKAHDKIYIENTALRAGRRARLEQLREDNPDAGEHLALLVPDGASLCDAPPPRVLALEAGEEERDGDHAAVAARGAGGGVVAEVGAKIKELRHCYTCKVRYDQLHSFYDQLCPTCAELNFIRRGQTADLSGRVAMVTGARVKIGFRVALKLLRAGAIVVASSRFPRDALSRYQAEADFSEWGARLHCVGLDLRDIPAAEHLTQVLADKFGKLDILVNNACQTVRRTAAYYSPQVVKEEGLAKAARENNADHPSLLFHRAFEATHKSLLEAGAKAGQSQRLGGGGASSSGKISSIGEDGDQPPVPHAASLRMDEGEHVARVDGKGEGGALGGGWDGVRGGVGEVAASARMAETVLTVEDATVGEEMLPSGAQDVNGSQVDLRRKHSWLLKMQEVSAPELMEVMCINAVAPFTLNARLVPLMKKGDGVDRFIINVSAMEGKFYRYKTPHHPHTNMAKAALNMLTRTSAEDLFKCDILMNSVDTGWINDENPAQKAAAYAKASGFQTPIDEEDAAARILDPVFGNLLRGERLSGLFLKDYKPTEW